MQDGGDALRGCRVLIVEDEVLIAMELESLVAEQGWTAMGPVPTVERALALLDQERPDVVILDLNLNGQSSAPVAAVLIARDVPFILATGYGEARSLQPELKDAPRIDKPVNHQQLVRALVQALSAASG